MNSIANILFDLDGSKGRNTKSILNQLGLPAQDADALHWCIGPPLRTTFACLLESSDESLIREAITYYRIRFTEIGLFENKVYPCVPRALQRIRALGIRSFVATSKPEVFAIRILDHFDLSSLFNSIHGSELDGTRSDKGTWWHMSWKLRELILRLR